MRTIRNLIGTSMLVCMFLFTVTVNIYGQHTVGFIGGLSHNDLKFNDSRGSNALTSPFIGMNVGAVLDLDMGNSIHLYTGALYTKKGGIKKADLSNPDIRFKLSYLELPILFKFQFGKKVRPYVMAGPSISLLVDSKADARTGVSDPGGEAFYQASLQNIHSPIDIGVTGGAGLSVTVNKAVIFVETRYTFGLTDIHQGGEICWKTEEDVYRVESPSGIEVWNRSLQFMAGVMFPLSK